MVLAAVALLLAAALAAGVGGLNPSSSTLDEPGSTDGEDIEFDWERLIDLIEELDLEWLLDLFEPDGEPREPACTVVLSNQPTPGTQTTVYIQTQGQPVVDASVWFNGQFIGTTDERGAVTGTIPYERQLVVEVATEDGTKCVAGDAIQGAQLGTLATQPQSEQPGNSSIEYAVRGSVAIDVLEPPYPGETVPIQITINGVPVPDAVVRIDGTERGRTNTEGRLDVSLPDDDRDSVRIAVHRGDFEGAVTVDLLTLEARIEPRGLVPFPGSDGALVAEVGEEPAAGATVSVDGDPIGTTDEQGRLPIEMPIDPRTSITVTTSRQTTTITVLEQFLPLLAFLGVVLGIGGIVAYRWIGWRGPILMAGGAGSILAVLGGVAYYGSSGGVIVAGLVALPWIGLLMGLIAGRYSMPRVRVSTPSLTDIGDRIYDLIVWLVDGIDGLVDWVMGTLGRVSRSITLRSVQRHPIRAVRQFGRALVDIRWTILRVIVALVLLSVGYLAGDGVGLLVVASGLVVIWLIGLTRDTTPEERGEQTVPEKEAIPTADSDEEREEFRTFWRSFARLVREDRWESSTPGEIARDAHMRGYPTYPVDALSDAFRAVEYGDRPLTQTVYEQARIAYRSIAIWHETEGDES